MTLFSAEEARQFEDSVNEFVDDQGTRGGGPLWPAIAGLGWLSLTIPESDDGMGGGLAELVVLQRACGRGLLAEPLLFTVGMALPLIIKVAAPEQRKVLLPKIASGSLRLAIGLADSPAGCVYECQGTDFVLSGALPAVHGATTADLVMVRARRQSEHALFLINPRDRQVNLQPFTLIDGCDAADMTLERVRVNPEHALVSPLTDSACTEALRRGMILASAEAVGAMDALVKMTIDYAKVRSQFGQPVGTFQVIQHRLVDMTIAARRARSLVDAAARAVDDGAADAAWLASACKIVAARAGRFVGEQAIQIHGGIGMSEEYPAGKYFRRLIKLGGLFGGGEAHLGMIAAAAWQDHDHDLVV